MYFTLKQNNFMQLKRRYQIRNHLCTYSFNRFDGIFLCFDISLLVIFGNYFRENLVGMLSFKQNSGSPSTIS